MAYLADMKSMAVDHREQGKTYEKSQGAPNNSEIAENWSKRWSSSYLPEDPITLDLRLQEIPQYKLKAIIMVKQNGVAVVNILQGLFLLISLHNYINAIDFRPPRKIV